MLNETQKNIVRMYLSQTGASADRMKEVGMMADDAVIALVNEYRDTRLNFLSIQESEAQGRKDRAQAELDAINAERATWND